MNILNTERIGSEDKILHELYFKSLAAKAAEVSSIIKNCGLCLKSEFKERMGIEDNGGYNESFHSAIATLFILNLITEILDRDNTNISIYIAGIQRVLFDIFWSDMEPREGVHQEEFIAASLKMKNTCINMSINKLTQLKNEINGIED